MVRRRSRIAKITAIVGDPKRQEGSIIACIAQPEHQIYCRQLMIDEVTLDVGLDCKFFVVGASCSVWCTSVAGQK